MHLRFFHFVIFLELKSSSHFPLFWTLYTWPLPVWYSLRNCNEQLHLEGRVGSFSKAQELDFNNYFINIFILKIFPVAIIMFFFLLDAKKKQDFITIFRAILNIYGRTDRKKEVLWDSIGSKWKKYILITDASLVSLYEWGTYQIAASVLALTATFSSYSHISQGDI